MSFKNKLKYGLVDKAMHQQGIQRLLKRLLIITVVIGTIFIITTGVVVGYVVSQINKLAVNRSDAELVALNNLLTSNQIVLTEQQKTNIKPLINSLANAQDTRQIQKIEAQILNNLDKQQLRSIQTWQQNMETESKGILNIGYQALAGKISTYTGISVEDSQRLLGSISAWLNLNPLRDNVKTNLQKQIEKSP